MSDERQIHVPESFILLFKSRSTGRLIESREEIESRHDWCEDLAQALVEPTRDSFWALNLDETTVLERTLQGLKESGMPERDVEQAWVIRRLCELLEWSPQLCPGILSTSQD
ncbi:MAG: ATPase with chaperone activity [Burkholderiaceae bacterium]